MLLCPRGAVFGALEPWIASAAATATRQPFRRAIGPRRAGELIHGRASAARVPSAGHQPAAGRVREAILRAVRSWRALSPHPPLAVESWLAQRSVRACVRVAAADRVPAGRCDNRRAAPSRAVGVRATTLPGASGRRSSRTVVTCAGVGAELAWEGLGRESI